MVDSRKIEVGQRLSQERQRLGYTQRDFSTALNIGYSTLTSWEAGKAAPEAVALSRAAELGVDVLYVITGTTGTGGLMSPDEMMVLGAWRDASPAVRSGLLGFFRSYADAVQMGME